MEDAWARKFRKLTVSLILSGALNIGLLAAFVAFVFQDSSGGIAAPKRRSAEEQKPSKVAALQAMSKLSFRELVALLTNRDLVEEGYTKRDLAVAALTAFHHFNLEKAVAGPLSQARTISIGEGESIEIYPGLSDEQFEGIIRFAYQEKWPLTVKGLFSLLQKLPAPHEESLEQAFFITPEFYALQVLFQKTAAPQEPAPLLQLATEGSWELFDRFLKEQAQLLDLSVEKRRRLLLSYLAHHSKTAAQLLLKTDEAFALKRLDDRGILDLLALLSQRTGEAERFCGALLQSPRSDVVWQSAAERLYAFAGEPMPAPFDAKEVRAHFGLAKAEPKPAALPPALPPQPVVSARYHVVKEGESLWKIARQYKVKPEDVAHLNGVDKDKLFPGMTLKIPD